MNFITNTLKQQILVDWVLYFSHHGMCTYSGTLLASLAQTFAAFLLLSYSTSYLCSKHIICVLIVLMH